MSEPNWSPLQRRLHWIVAVIVLVQYVLQEPMRAANAAAEAGENIGLIDFLVSSVHTWGGTAIGALVVARLMLRQTGSSSPAGAQRNVLAHVALWHHRFLYAVLVVMVLSGLFHYYLGIASAARWHEVGKWVLLAAVALHIIAALWHYRRGVD